MLLVPMPCPTCQKIMSQGQCRNRNCNDYEPTDEGVEKDICNKCRRKKQKKGCFPCYPSYVCIACESKAPGFYETGDGFDTNYGSTAQSISGTPVPGTPHRSGRDQDQASPIVPPRSGFWSWFNTPQGKRLTNTPPDSPVVVPHLGRWDVESVPVPNFGNNQDAQAPIFCVLEGGHRLVAGENGKVFYKNPDGENHIPVNDIPTGYGEITSFLPIDKSNYRDYPHFRFLLIGYSSGKVGVIRFHLRGDSSVWENWRADKKLFANFWLGGGDAVVSPHANGTDFVINNNHIQSIPFQNAIRRLLLIPV